MPNNFFVPTTPRRDTWQTRSDPRSLMELLYAGLLLAACIQMPEFLPPDFILLIDQDVSGPTSVKEGLIQKRIVLSPTRRQNIFIHRGNSGFFRKFGPVLILLDLK